MFQTSQKTGNCTDQPTVPKIGKWYHIKKDQLDGTWAKVSGKWTKVQTDEYSTHFCDKCDYAATRKEAYVKHVKVVHDRIKDFICSLCPSAFGQKAHLKAHVDNVHIKYNEDPAKNLPANQEPVKFILPTLIAE